MAWALPLVACTTTAPLPDGDVSAAGMLAWSTGGADSSQAGALLHGAQPLQATQSDAGIPWQHVTFPGKAATEFSYVHHGGRHSVASRADSSASMLRKTVRVEPADLGQVSFAWKLPELNLVADMARRDKDDSPVRVVLAFEGDRSRLSAKDAMLSELARALTGEELPYATLMYVWCNHRAPGEIIVNPRTDRVRAMVVESGAKRLNQWLDYRRDIRADFQAAFGEAPGALVGVAIMSDSDNTRVLSNAWFGTVRISPTLVTQTATP